MPVYNYIHTSLYPVDQNQQHDTTTHNSGSERCTGADAYRQTHAIWRSAWRRTACANIGTVARRMRKLSPPFPITTISELHRGGTHTHTHTHNTYRCVREGGREEGREEPPATSAMAEIRQLAALRKFSRKH